ncbi:hypothetical protein AB0O07_06745 [Streptomyces sp. NPDC093085]|uniref:hypothetical protein n=1 Tax=Streptomyces sp. NPDC093085 TaxID=3155068 RepID=UPI0034300100
MATENPAPSYTMLEDDGSTALDLYERIHRINCDPDSATQITALFPVHWTGNSNDVVTLQADGSVAVDMDGTFEPPEPFNRSLPSMMITTTDGRVAVFDAARPAGQTIESGFRSLNIPVPDVIQALNAREAALVGDRPAVDAFTSGGLRLWSGWNEPVSTALLGSWADPLHEQGHLTPDALKELRSEIKAINRQLTPVWRRKVNKSRLWLLDTPLGDGLTLYDLVADQAADAGVEVAFEDPRLVEVLEALSPVERAVTLALTHPGVTTWAKAAIAAGAAHPERLGEQVRRKVKRLAKRCASAVRR